MQEKYISPLPIVARVKEEFKSYFSTNAIDDLLFPIYVADCINKLERTYNPIHEAILDMCNHKCDLPCDFKSYREVWMCATHNKGPIVSPFVFYYQTDCRINPAPSQNNSCGDCVEGYQCTPPNQTPTPVNLPDLCGVPDEFRVTHKIMETLSFSFRVTGLLKPGNFKTVGRGDEHSPNKESNLLDTFDIVGNHLITSFDRGTIYLSYYANPIIDESGYPEIPDNEPFNKYIYHYLRTMIYQNLFDQATQEDIKLIELKLQKEEEKMWIAYINAKNYALSSDIYGVQKSIVRSYNRNNRFLIR